MEHIKLPVAVHLIMLQNEKILLQRRFNTGYEDGKYGIVAGHINGNETIVQAMLREAYEEAGIHLNIKHTNIVQVMHRKKSNEERIDYFINCSNWFGEIQNMEIDKCDDLSWFPIKDLPQNMIGYVRFAIDSYLKNIQFTEYGW